MYKRRITCDTVAIGLLGPWFTGLLEVCFPCLQKGQRRVSFLNVSTISLIRKLTSHFLDQMFLEAKMAKSSA